ncbi:MAG: NAD-dependent epimerase/dehydratase family protein [Puniceicoccaceae bacterium]|nr:MAG: NAD-dependent epimerase/dehydratase family protein [Puniceicoccaceae bacterium]
MMANGSGRSLPTTLFILGCGYVGRALALRALGRGWRVGALTRNPATASDLRALGLNPVLTADLAHHSWHEAAGGGWSLVVNTVSSAGGGEAGYLHSYVNGNRSALAWLAGRPCRVYLYTGSTSVYPQTEGEWVDETSSTEPAAGAAVHLLGAERLVLEAAVPAARRLVLRLAGIYGPDRHVLLDRIHAGEPIPGRADTWLNLIHRDDIVEAILTCLDGGETAPAGLYNLSDGAPATRGDFAAWLAERLGLPEPCFDEAAAGPRRASLSSSAPRPNRRVSNRSFCQAFGWKPRYPSFREGFAELLERPSSGS